MAINHLEEADLLHHHQISCEFLRPACRRGAWPAEYGVASESRPL